MSSFVVKDLQILGCDVEDCLTVQLRVPQSALLELCEAKKKVDAFVAKTSDSLCVEDCLRILHDCDIFSLCFNKTALGKSFVDDLILHFEK